MFKFLLIISVIWMQLHPSKSEFRMGFAPKQFPWTVLVENNDKRLCFGTILSDEWVLATASCVKNKSSLQLFFGVTKMDEKVNHETAENTHVLELNMSATNLHPEYESFENNNLALLKLNKKLTFNDYIQPIHLPQNHHMTEDFTDFGGIVTFVSATTELTWNIIHVVSNANCSDAYNGITDGILCGVKYSKAEKTKCDFTSGQPLLIFENHKWTQIGVGIYRHTQKCDEFSPMGFERLTAHRAWIMNVTGVDPDKEVDNPEYDFHFHDYDDEDCVVECFVTLVIFVLFTMIIVGVFKLYAHHNNVNYFTLKI